MMHFVIKPWGLCVDEINIKANLYYSPFEYTLGLEDVDSTENFKPTQVKSFYWFKEYFPSKNSQFYISGYHFGHGKN